MQMFKQMILASALMTLVATGPALSMSIDPQEADVEVTAHTVVVTAAPDETGNMALTVSDDVTMDADGAVFMFATDDDPRGIIELNTVALGDDSKHVFYTAREPADPNAGWLGVILSEVSPALSAQLGLDEGAVMIDNLVEDSPAAAAGLERFDVIVGVNGSPIENGISGLAKQIGDLGPGAQARFTVVRNGQDRTLVATLGNRPETNATRWRYDFQAPSTVREKFRTKGRVIMQGPDGEFDVLDLGDLKELKELPDSIRTLIPSISDIDTQVWHGQGDTTIHIKTRVEENGSTMEIEQQDGGEIVVRRISTDQDGNTETVEETHANAEALEAADPEAFELFSKVQGPHVIDLHGALDGLDIKLNTLNVPKFDFHWQGDVQKSIDEAMKAYEEAMKSLDGTHGVKLHRRLPRMLDIHRHHTESAQRSFSVNPDGSIEVRLRKGDSEVVMGYRDAGDLAQRNPEMYEKYREVVDAPVED